MRIVVAILALALASGNPAGLRAQVADPVPAISAAEFADLVKLMAIKENIDVMHQEGLAHGQSLDTDLLGGRGGTVWARQVAAAYDPQRMRAVFLTRLERDMQAVPSAALTGFFASDLGHRVVGLELSARQALQDPAVEALADQMRDDMIARKDPRLALVRRFIEVSDLVEQNVAGAMNANYAFYRGLSQAGAFGAGLAEQDILRDVWSQEADTRAQAEGWLVTFLAMAYQPLTDADLLAYIAFSRTAPAQSLNRAMFAAFDEMFVGISRDLGQAAARIVDQQDL